MKWTIHMWAICALGGLLTGCGGGGSAEPGQPVQGPTTYEPGTPVAGATDVFKITSIDDSNNTTVVGYTQQVQSVSGAHSYMLTQADPTNASPIANGVDYHFNATTLTFDNDRETGVSDTSEGGTLQHCTFTLQSGGHAAPWWVGQTFALSVQESCTPGDLRSINESGTVAALEQVIHTPTSRTSWSGCPRSRPVASKNCCHTAGRSRTERSEPQLPPVRDGFAARSQSSR